MKITLAQINTTPNDFSGNFVKIQNGVEKANKDGSDVIVFPELTIPGYLVRDLVYTTGFVEKNLAYLQNVANLTTHSDITVIVGYIDRNTTGFGKPFRNMAAVIHNGVVIATHQKKLLPGYSVFEEFLYYEPGTDNCVFEVNGEKCGLLTCEDLWHNDKGETGNLRYEVNNPIEDLKRLNIKYLFTINSSPYAKDKPEHRVKMLSEISAHWGYSMNLIYVNQIGGNDELIFDGNSLIIVNGMVKKYLQTPIKPSANMDIYETVDVHDDRCPYIDYEYHLDHLKMTLLGLHDYVTKSGFKKVVLGSSGGVDSALVATLATIALGKENVNCIMMPSVYSSEGSVKDAQTLHKNLGCCEFKVPIEHMKLLDTLKLPFGISGGEHCKTACDYNLVADENIQARLRGVVVMYFSNAFGAMSITTSNKSESAVSYTTLFGDMAGTFSPIGDLYKMEVFDMCKLINKLFGKIIPDEILNKAPSAELKPNQTDEASLLPYPILDEICRLYIEEYVTDYKVYVKMSCNPTTEKEYNRITRMIYNSEFKRRQASPITKLSKIAFGTGPQITNSKEVTMEEVIYVPIDKKLWGIKRDYFWLYKKYFQIKFDESDTSILGRIFNYRIF